jgi:hypothetical protein
MHTLSRLEPERQGAPVSDVDIDGLEDGADNCPYTANRPQLDTGGIGITAPDGRGDRCQCGDADADASVLEADVGDIVQCLSGSACGALCDGNGDGSCDARDVTSVQVALHGLGPLRCAALDGAPGGS